MSLNKFLEQVKNNQDISFENTLQIITDHYHYQPTEFSNGLGADTLINSAATNEGSCKIFSFSQLNHLSEQQTLNLFGDFYRKDVLEDPMGNGHQNIRNFIKYGWKGIIFKMQPLSPK